MRFPQFWRFRIICFIAAFNGITFQLASFKILHLLLGNSLYSATVNLAVYLLGLNFGIRWGARFSQGGKRLHASVLSSLLFGSYLTLVCFNYDQTFYFLDRIFTVFPPGSRAFSMTVIATLFLAIPAVANGLLFNLIYQFFDENAATRGLAFSRFMSIDTAASVIGALAVGFWAIPILGLDSTLLLVSGLAVVVALLLDLKLTLRWSPVLVVAVLPLFFHQSDKTRLITEVPKSLLSAEDFLNETGPLGSPAELKALLSEESPYGLVSVFEGGNGNVGMYLNRRPLCFYAKDPKELSQLSETRIAQDALSALKGRIKGLGHMADIGLGCGVTLSTLLHSFITKQLDVIEINPVVKKGNAFFEPLLGYDLRDDRIRFTLADAFHFFREKSWKTPYHLIVMDVEEPTITYSTPLYTLEFFKTIQDALVKDGIFAIWNYMSGSEAYQAIVYKTLQQIFAYVYVKFYPGTMTSSSSFFASQKPINPGFLGMTDSDLTTSYRLKAMDVEVNSLKSMSLLKEWRRSQPMLEWR